MENDRPGFLIEREITLLDGDEAVAGRRLRGNDLVGSESGPSQCPGLKMGSDAR